MSSTLYQTSMPLSLSTRRRKSTIVSLAQAPAAAGLPITPSVSAALLSLPDPKNGQPLELLGIVREGIHASDELHACFE